MNSNFTTDDPVIDLLLSGRAATAAEAEELYLDASIPDVLRLVEGELTDTEFRAHPLIQLLLAHGSRGREDSLW